MEAMKLLCDSFLCRLCAEENKNGTNLFPEKENEQDLSQLVNKYLPLKVENDGKLPCTICPGCNIQLEATKLFLDLIVEGQSKLRDILKVQQETLKRQEKQRLQLEEALKNVSPKSSVETYTIQSDETGEKFLIQILSEGPLFPPEHELSLKAEGLDKPKRKRGRPPKPPPSAVEEQQPISNTENEEKLITEPEIEDDNDGDNRRKRRVKVPSRFQEAVQGKELDRIFKEVGVIDDDSLSEEDNSNKTNINSLKTSDEIIGHMQSKDGENLGDLILNKNKNMKVKTKNGQVLIKKKKKYTCDICAREFLHFGRYEVHKSFHQNVRYECEEEDCNVQTSEKLPMEQHQSETGHSKITVIENVADYGELQLPKTEQTLSSEIDIKAECERKTDKINCTICNKTFSCKQNYDVHMKAVHENVKPFFCDKCNKSFPYYNSLKCHILQHTDKNDKMYPCEICNKIFNHPSSLVYHKEAEHNNGRRFVCSKCNKSFKHKQLLQRHQLVHSDERPHNCKLCDATFKTKANLINHMPIHTGEKKYFCSQCGQTFAHKTSLTLHTRWHNGQKPYQCDICMKSFSQKGNLAEHKRIHTGEKPYCCDHCGRKFTTSSQFKLHVKRHTGERPWRCEYCGKTFLHKDTWKCHTRRHRNERPYQCTECLRGFTEQWALKKHERLHTGEKPYVCDVCNKGFADCSNLTKHKKIHLNRNKARPVNKVPIKIVNGEENQVLYVTYENATTENGEEQTFVHIMDSFNSLQSLSSQENNLDKSLLDGSSDPLAMDEVEQLSSDTNLVEEFVDEDGNSINLTTPDGQTLKVVTIVEDGQSSVQGLMSDGTLVPINLTMQNGKAVSAAIVSPVTMCTDIQMKNEDSNESIPPLNSSETELLDSNIQFLGDDNSQKLENNIQFLDAQNVFVIDNINSQYLSVSQF